MTLWLNVFVVIAELTLLPPRERELVLVDGGDTSFCHAIPLEEPCLQETRLGLAATVLLCSLDL